jgi:type VI secretion system secreted protein VgrG
MPTATDSKRIAKAHTPVSSLVFRSIAGREELSRLFEYKLELIAEDDRSIDPKQLLGRSIVAEIMIQGGGSRYINGECVRFSYAGTEYAGERNTTLWRYDAVLRPWLWYATRTSTCKIWQKKTVPDMVKAVLGKYPYAVDWRISRSYREWNYCVQYEETDFNFVSRLLEHEGIYYWFEHSAGSCTLVLADDMGAHLTLPGYGSIPFMLSDMMARPDEEWIDHWQMTQEVDSGRYVADDYYYRTPSAELQVERQKPLGFPWDSQEVYEWPGGYTEPTPWGEQYAQTRIEELQQSKEVVSGKSNARGLACGYLFNLERSQRYDQDRQYMIRAVTMYLRDNPYTTGGPPTDWQFVLEAQPIDFPYRPPRLTRKPHTTGPPTAVCTGPEGEEIYTDDEGLGRVKVWFPWDREKDVPPQDRSCWIRVSTTWAGNKWGQISLPRIGQEVIVEYIDGDPDYPIITGRCYNQEHIPPYTLPKYKEYSTIKSHSTKKGGPMEWNELRFYDYKGKEQVFIHCQWRMDVRVKWKKYETVKESSHFLMGACFMTAGGEYDIYAGADFYTQCKGGQYVIQGADHHSDTGGNSLHLVTAEKEVNARSITLEAAKSVVLKVGGSFVEVSPMGVTIQGPLVRINSGGSASPTGAVKMGTAAHASPADTGEEGYLDRPYKGGGGGSRWYTKEGYHSRPVTYDPGDGSFTYGGSGVVVKGTPDFADKTLQTLGGLDSTPTGKQLIDNLQSNGKTVTIKEATPAEAASSGGGVAKPLGPNGVPAGETDPEFPGTVSDGSGTDTEVHWVPGTNGTFTDEKGVTHTQPDEALLGHELIHSDGMANGTDGINHPDPAEPTSNQSESTAIGINDHKDDPVTENNILKDLGEDWQRTDHDSNAKSLPP